MKGVSGLIAFVLVFGVILTTVTVVYLAGKPIVERSQDSAVIAESSNILNAMDNVIKEVVYGKAGSSRVLTLSITGGEYFVRNDDNSIEFSLDTDETFIEPSGQTRNGNFYRSGTRQATAAQKTINTHDSLVLENSRIIFAIKNVPTSGTINTTNMTVLFGNKNIGLNLTPLDTSVVVNDNSATSSGTGYTFMVDNGTRYGYAQIVARFTGTPSYDIYYTLHSNADFVNVEVQNSTAVNNVTFNFETSIASGTAASGTNYLTYSNSTIATGLYHDGSTLTSATSSGNKLTIKQPYVGNGILQIFTVGPSTIISDASLTDINQWSGSFGYGINKEPKYYAWLYYPIINFTKNETLGRGQYKIYIYNNGTSNGKAQIEISKI